VDADEEPIAAPVHANAHDLEIDDLHP
jgi:hypothetical protein